MTRFNLIRLCTISVLFCTFNIDVAYNQQFTGAGTTRGIKDIFLGRCAEVTNGLVNPQLSKDELRLETDVIFAKNVFYKDKSIYILDTKL